MVRLAGGIALTFVAAGLSLSTFATDVNAQELPKSTLKILGDLKLDRSILDGVDAELKVPADWMDRAKAEGTVIYGAPDTESQFRAYTAPFAERYPFIRLQYESATYDERVIKPLLAYKQGRYLVDITSDITGSIHLFREANALTDLRDIPNVKNIGAGMVPEAGDWLPLDVHFWCMAYNTVKEKKSELPATWDELLSNKAVNASTLGVNDRTMTWMPGLYKEWGPERSAKFLTDLMQSVRPQPRQEGVNALTGLTALGEVPLSIPASDKQVYTLAAKGGTVGWHCPEPIPASLSEIAVFKGSPHTYAAKIFINWLLSREGQIAQYSQITYSPVHKDLPVEKWAIYGDEIKGKKIALIDINRSDEDAVDVQKLWTPLWQERIRSAK